MKQPDDKKTLELMLEEGAKRGRGRPAKADAMTGAERAKKFRDTKRAADALNPKNKCDVTKNTDDQALLNLTKERDSLAEMVRELEAKIREMSRDMEYKTRSLVSAHSELRIMTEKFEATSKAPKSSLTITKLQTECFELQHQITLLTTTEKTKMDELRMENSTLRERIIKMAGELDAAQQEVMAASPRIKVTEAKPSRKKATTKAK